MLTMKLTFRGKCELHPRYDPSKEGESGIKGGCRRCHALLDLCMKAVEYRKLCDAFLHNPASSVTP